MKLVQTPVQDYRAEFGLLVKREDLCCPDGPHFSKTRGVYAHVASRPEPIIGVLDTYHSQAGWAVAQACKALGKECVNFFPVRKADREKPIQEQQMAAGRLGARLEPLQAGRSAILYHEAKRELEMLRARIYSDAPAYMMPNALKLREMVTETAAEVERTLQDPLLELPLDNVIIAISSGTIAAGVIAGFDRFTPWRPNFLLHMGYSRSHSAVRRYIDEMSGGRLPAGRLHLIDEGFNYGDAAAPDPAPPFPSNKYYDLKAFRWWNRIGHYGHAGERTLFWNIG